MTFFEYKTKVYSTPLVSQRLGQYAFNLLHVTQPDLARILTGNPSLDPYYDDSKIHAFMAFVEDHWQEVVF